ncbi:MAG TPA: hypothetical protein VGE39_15985 [Prosthecobacter sp.]
MKRLLLVICLGGHAYAQHCHQQGNVRIFYHTEGQHAVEPADVNANSVPDQVEDAMTQIIAARLLFVEALGFPDPFQGERFRSASFLDVHFRHKDILKSNGVAYDELQRYKRPQDPPGTLSLCFNMATSVRPSTNLTPSHEFFHIIQNGVTCFKNSWYTEGTARWSERGLGAGGLGPARLANVWPGTDEERAALFQRSYDASEFFWNVLARQHDKDKGEIPASAALTRLQAMRYVDGTPVLRDTQFTGWRFIRTVLLELGKVQAAAAKGLGYDAWSEANQKSPQNGPHILRAVQAVAKDIGHAP